MTLALAEDGSWLQTGKGGGGEEQPVALEKRPKLDSHITFEVVKSQQKDDFP